MLVLSRKRNECIRVGHDIIIRVIEIRGDKVRIGVEAPESVAVHRQEVYEAIQRDGVRAQQEKDLDHDCAN